TGATVVMERTFDAGRVLSLIEDRRITTLMAVPTQYLMLAEHPDFADTDLSSLRLAVVGGASMPPALLRVWHARGVPLVQGYGLTEAGPNVLSLPRSEEHTSELQSRFDLVCRLLLEKKKHRIANVFVWCELNVSHR